MKPNNLYNLFLYCLGIMISIIIIRRIFFQGYERDLKDGTPIILKRHILYWSVKSLMTLITLSMLVTSIYILLF